MDVVDPPVGLGKATGFGDDGHDQNMFVMCLCSFFKSLLLGAVGL